MRVVFVTLLPVVVMLFPPVAWAQGSGNGRPLQAKNITLAVGSRAVLPCHSPRALWTQDRLRDRQRVVHWDVIRNTAKYSERLLDMSPGTRPRLYDSADKGRLSIPDSAFKDGNFSLVITDVVQSDRGVYTCNLHHHYCQNQQSVRIQLDVTKSALKQKHYWDGEKMVLVALLGSSLVLPCVNRHSLWRDGLQEDQQQVVHWDFQPPGVRPDRAERLVDLYASGERRDYGPLVAHNKMSVADDAFRLGDFSLSISDLRPLDRGLYSCHLHHHYCGLHERRVFRLIVVPWLATEPTAASEAFPNDRPKPRIKDVDGPHVVNVILPEHQSHVVQHVGYFLAAFLLLAFVGVAILALTRRRQKRDLAYHLRRYDERSVIYEGERSSDCTELKSRDPEPSSSDYKNNILKERDMSKDCNKDFDGKLWK